MPDPGIDIGREPLQALSSTTDSNDGDPLGCGFGYQIDIAPQLAEMLCLQARKRL